MERERESTREQERERERYRERAREREREREMWKERNGGREIEKDRYGNRERGREGVWERERGGERGRAGSYFSLSSSSTTPTRQASSRSLGAAVTWKEPTRQQLHTTGPSHLTECMTETGFRNEHPFHRMYILMSSTRPHTPNPNLQQNAIEPQEITPEKFPFLG